MTCNSLNIEGKVPCSSLLTMARLRKMVAKGTGVTKIKSGNGLPLNSAYAMGVADILGSVTTGKLANLIVTKRVPSLAFIPYCHQTPFINKVILRG